MTGSKRNPLDVLSYAELRDLDVLDEWEGIEKILRGKSVEITDEERRLGMMECFRLRQNAIAKKLAAAEDLQFGNRADDALRVAHSIGFRIVGEWSFQGEESDGSFWREGSPYFVPKGEHYTDRLTLLASDDPMLLKLETYWGGLGTNKVNLYLGGEFKDPTKKPWGFSGTGGPKGVWQVDVREGLRHIVNLVRENVIFSPRWKDVDSYLPSLYLRTYMEWKTTDKGEAADRARQTELPPEIQQIFSR